MQVYSIYCTYSEWDATVEAAVEALLRIWHTISFVWDWHMMTHDECVSMKRSDYSLCCNELGVWDFYIKDGTR